MDQAKELTDLVFKREKMKQKQAQITQEILQSFILSYTNGLRHTFEGIMS